MPVLGAVERPRGRPREAAGRLHGSGEQPEFWRTICAPALCEDFAPAVLLGIADDGGHELADPVARRARRHRLLRLVLGPRRAVQILGALDQHPRVDAKSPADQSEHDDGADTQSAGATRPAGKPALAPRVFDIVTAAKLIPAHGACPRAIRLSRRREINPDAPWRFRLYRAWVRDSAWVRAGGKG